MSAPTLERPDALGTCRCGCARELVSQRVEPATGQVRHHGRGLCAGGRARAARRNELVEHPRSTHSAGELLDAFAELRDELPTVAVIAARLGVSVGALDRALCRARAAEDPRGLRHSPRPSPSGAGQPVSSALDWDPGREVDLPCRRDPDRWYSTIAVEQQKAAATCWARCSRVVECLALALAAREEFGVWGGQTPAERRRELRGPAYELAPGTGQVAPGFDRARHDRIMDGYAALAGEGLSRREAARRLGMARSKLDQVLRRARALGDRRARPHTEHGRAISEALLAAADPAPVARAR